MRNIKYDIDELLEDANVPNEALKQSASGAWEGIKQFGANVRDGASNLVQHGAGAIHDALPEGVAKSIIHPLTSAEGAKGLVAGATVLGGAKLAKGLINKGSDLKSRVMGGGGY